MKSGARLGIKPSSKTTTTAGREWSNREGTKPKNLPRPPLLHKNGIPASTGTHGHVRVPVSWLPILFSGPLQLETHLSGLTGHSPGRLKLPEDSLPRPYWDPKTLLPRPYECGSSIPVGGRLMEFANEWMGIMQDSSVLCLIEGHLLKFN